MLMHNLAQPVLQLASDGFHVDELTVHQLAVEIEDEREAARHSRTEISPRRAEYHGIATGHVLQSVVANAFRDYGGARVAHAEPFADNPAKEHLPAGRAVSDHVATDDILLGGERCGLVGTHDETAA